MTTQTLAGEAPRVTFLQWLSRTSTVRVLRTMLRDPVTAVAAGFLLAIVVVAIAAPLIAPYDPAEIRPFSTLTKPDAAHPLGTDENGRDVLSRLIYGARVSLAVGVISVGFALALGVPLGLVAGFFGGGIDAVVMRLMDSILAFPALILALAIVAVLGTGVVQLMVAIGVTSIPVYARLVRAQVLSLKNQDFTLAAHALGAPAARILGRHILPNTLAPIIVQGSLGIAFAILSEAGLSFLGLGIKPPTASWGGMLQTAVRYIYRSPMLSIAPGVAIFLTVLALNIVGDALRDTLDPRLRGKLQEDRR